MYRITLRLSEVFEEQIWNIISDYRKAVKSSKKLCHSQTYPKKHQHPELPAIAHRSTRLVLLSVLHEKTGAGVTSCGPCSGLGQKRDSLHSHQTIHTPHTRVALLAFE